MNQGTSLNETSQIRTPHGACHLTKLLCMHVRHPRCQDESLLHHTHLASTDAIHVHVLEGVEEVCVGHHPLRRLPVDLFEPSHDHHTLAHSLHLLWRLGKRSTVIRRGGKHIHQSVIVNYRCVNIVQKICISSNS